MAQSLCHCSTEIDLLGLGTALGSQVYQGDVWWSGLSQQWLADEQESEVLLYKLEESSPSA